MAQMIWGFETVIFFVRLTNFDCINVAFGSCTKRRYLRNASKIFLSTKYTYYLSYLQCLQTSNFCNNIFQFFKNCNLLFEWNVSTVRKAQLRRKYNYPKCIDLHIRQWAWISYFLWELRKKLVWHWLRWWSLPKETNSAVSKVFKWNWNWHCTV